MDYAKILELMGKGLGVLEQVMNATPEVVKIIDRMKRLSEGGQKGTVTDAELAEIEAELDRDLAEFNADIPDDPS